VLLHRQSATEEISKSSIFDGADYLTTFNNELRQYLREMNCAKVVDVLNRIIEKDRLPAAPGK
jgi:hypothetical protein